MATSPPGFESGSLGQTVPKTRAPKAWHGFAQEATVRLPTTLQQVARVRRRLGHWKPR